MSAPPPNDNNPSSRFSFDDPQRQQPQQYRQQQRRRVNEEGQTFTDEVIDTVDDTLGCSNRLFGCMFSLITLPFRLVWRIVEGIFD